MLVFIACLVVICGLIVSAILFGAPSGAIAYVELVVLMASSIILLHNLAMHMLPAARGRSHPEAGIFQSGVPLTESVPHQADFLGS